MDTIQRVEHRHHFRRYQIIIYPILPLMPPSPSYRSGLSTTVSFVSTSTKDFHLASADTAAKNAGADLSADANLAVTTDVEGYLRPTGAGVVDIGADEQGATAMPTTGYIPANLDNNRYVRYKAYFTTSDTAYTPSLDDITINYLSATSALTTATSNAVAVSAAPWGRPMSSPRRWSWALKGTQLSVSRPLTPFPPTARSR